MPVAQSSAEVSNHRSGEFNYIGLDRRSWAITSFRKNLKFELYIFVVVARCKSKHSYPTKFLQNAHETNRGVLVCCLITIVETVMDGVFGLLRRCSRGLC